jgi:hypothetical protein
LKRRNSITGKEKQIHGKEQEEVKDVFEDQQAEQVDLEYCVEIPKTLRRAKLEPTQGAAFPVE